MPIKETEDELEYQETEPSKLELILRGLVMVLAAAAIALGGWAVARSPTAVAEAVGYNGSAIVMLLCTGGMV